MQALSQDQLKALKYLIKQTVVGEIQDVLVHLGTIVGDIEVIKTNTEVLESLKKWYETHRYHVPLGQDKVGMVT